MSILYFEELDAPAEEVMARFSVEAALEVILLIATGDSQAPIEGVVPQWDAARYHG